MISNLLFIFLFFPDLRAKKTVNILKKVKKNLMFSLNKENVGTGEQSLNFLKIVKEISRISFLFFFASFLYLAISFKQMPLCSSLTLPSFSLLFSIFLSNCSVEKSKIILQKCFKKCCSWSKYQFTFFHEIIYIRILIFFVREIT